MATEDDGEPAGALEKTAPERTQTRDRILDAAITTLATQGFSKSSARAVARTGGFTPGVIYYHFAGLDDLFVATAEYISTERLARYRSATDDVTSAVELVAQLRQLYQEDQASGHVAAIQELVAAAVSSPRLADQVRAQGAMWQELAENLIRAQIKGSLFEAFVPVSELASVGVGAYLGLEMLSHLHADRTAPEALFDAALPAATMIDALRTPT